MSSLQKCPVSVMTAQSTPTVIATVVLPGGREGGSSIEFAVCTLTASTVNSMKLLSCLASPWPLSRFSCRVLCVLCMAHAVVACVCCVCVLLQEAAVKGEDFVEAKRCKAAEEWVRRVGGRLAVLEKQKVRE